MRTLLAMFVLCATASLAVAGDDVNEDYTITMVAPAETFAGGGFDMELTFTNDGIDVNGVQGGVCADTENVDIEEGDIDDDGVADLDTTFAALNVFVDTNDWNFGFLMNVITGAVILPHGPDEFLSMYVATYSVSADIVDGVEDSDDCDDALDVINLTFCDIGVPPVTTAVIAAGDQNPIREEATICVSAQPPFGDYCISDVTILYNFDTGEGAGSSTISIDEDIAEGGDARETDGFQCAIRYDDTRFEAVGMTAIGELADMNDGAGPGFFGVNVAPGNGPGITVGVVYNLGAGSETILFDEKKDVIDVDWETIPLENAAIEGSTDFDVDFVNDLGNPVLPNSMVVDGVSLTAKIDDAGVVTLVGFPEAPFIRGDCNDDGTVNLADAIWQLEEVNRGGPTIDCLEACDTNDDGLYDNSDAVYCLNYRFLEGPEPPSQFPDCGITGEDPAPDCGTPPGACD